MEPREFYYLALRLVQNDSAADIRTAISRGYYAAYHVAFSTLQELGFSPSVGWDGHDDVRKHLRASGDKAIVKVGNRIGNLHSMRVDADYRLDDTSIEKQKRAMVALGGVLRVIEELEACPNATTRAAIVAAISAWVSAGKPPISG